MVFGIIWPLFGDWTHASSWGGGAFRFELWAGVLVMGRRHIKTPRIHTEGHNASSTPIPRSMGPFVKYAQIKSSVVSFNPDKGCPARAFSDFVNPG